MKEKTKRMQTIQRFSAANPKKKKKKNEIHSRTRARPFPGSIMLSMLVWNVLWVSARELMMLSSSSSFAVFFSFTTSNDRYHRCWNLRNSQHSCSYLVRSNVTKARLQSWLMNTKPEPHTKEKKIRKNYQGHTFLKEKKSCEIIEISSGNFGSHHRLNRSKWQWIEWEEGFRMNWCSVYCLSKNGIALSFRKKYEEQKLKWTCKQRCLFHQYPLCSFTYFCLSPDRMVRVPRFLINFFFFFFNSQLIDYWFPMTHRSFTIE